MKRYNYEGKHFEDPAGDWVKFEEAVANLTTSKDLGFSTRQQMKNRITALVAMTSSLEVQVEYKNSLITAQKQIIDELRSQASSGTLSWQCGFAAGKEAGVAVLLDVRGRL